MADDELFIDGGWYSKSSVVEKYMKIQETGERLPPDDDEARLANVIVDIMADIMANVIRKRWREGKE